MADATGKANWTRLRVAWAARARSRDAPGRGRPSVSPIGRSR